MINLRLYPQNDDRIVTADSVTSLHPMYIVFKIKTQLKRRLLQTIYSQSAVQLQTLSHRTYIM